jgi:hypothetical protein
MAAVASVPAPQVPAIDHQASPFSAIARTTTKPPRRTRADAERNRSNNTANTFAAAGF